MKPVPLLVSLIRCARCDALYRVGPPGFWRHPANPHCVYAKQQFPMQPIEDHVWNYLSENFVLPESHKVAIAKLAAQPAIAPDSPQAALEDKLKRLEDLFLDPVNVNGALLTKARYIELRQQITDQLDRIPPEPELSEGLDASLLKSIDRLGAVIELIHATAAKDPREAGNVLRTIFEKIVIEGDAIQSFVPREWCAALFPKQSQLESKGP